MVHLQLEFTQGCAGNGDGVALLRFYLSIHSNLIFVKIFICGPLTKAAPSSGRQCLPAPRLND
jgi:hypothetical protein